MFSGSLCRYNCIWVAQLLFSPLCWLKSHWHRFVCVSVWPSQPLVHITDSVLYVHANSESTPKHSFSCSHTKELDRFILFLYTGVQGNGADYVVEKEKLCDRWTRVIGNHVLHYIPCYFYITFLVICFLWVMNVRMVDGKLLTLCVSMYEIIMYRLWCNYKLLQKRSTFRYGNKWSLRHTGYCPAKCCCK